MDVLTTEQFDFSNTQFKLASDFVLYTSEHIFLTGKAGTGKTTFLKYIKQNCNKNLVITAPTGVAAINAGGVTLHSFFQLPFGTYIEHYRKSWSNTEEQFIVNKHQLLAKIRINRQKRKLINELELLIIDEASMVRADTLDAIDAVLKFVRKKEHLPFGGVQILFIGDLYQLPPVVRQHEMMIMNEHYASPFFFDAIALQEQRPITIELQQIYRQSDEHFIRVLNNIRNNDVQTEDYDLLHECYAPDYMPSTDSNIITLTTHNRTANSINNHQLKTLHSKAIHLDANVSGDFPEHIYPMEETLVLKEGAQVMFIKNDKGEDKRYYNGKIAVIHKIRKSDNEIEVFFPKEKNYLTVSPEAWENTKFKLNEEKNEIEQDIVGTFTHFPFRLAWAVTIHKSQGLTFDEAIIDAGRSFAPGQVYVALSRMTSMKGMILKSRIQPSAIMVDQHISHFMNQIPQKDYLEQQLSLGQKEYFEQEVIRSYAWTGILNFWNELLESGISQVAQERIIIDATYNEVNAALSKLDTVGTNFKKELTYYFYYKEWDKILERVAASIQWFQQFGQEKLINILEQWHEKLRVEKGASGSAKAVRSLLKRAQHHLAVLVHIEVPIKHLHEHKDIAKAITLLKPEIKDDDKRKTLKSKKEKAPKQPSYEISLELFKKGNSTTEIAQKRNCVESTIYGHLAQAVKAGKLDAGDVITSFKLLVIIDALDKVNATKLTDIKAALNHEYTFEELRIAIAHIEYQSTQQS